MKKILIFTFLILISCTEKTKQIPKDKAVKENETEFIEVILPKFDKWTESLKNPSIKKWTETTAVDSLTKHYAIYVSNKTDLNEFETDTTIFQDYAVLYIRKQEQKNRIVSKDLDAIFNKQLEILNIKRTSIDSLKYNIDVLPTKTFLLIEDYKINSNSKTGMFIMKQDINNPKRISVILLNLLNIKNHLFYCGYYLSFKDLNSFKIARENNELIVSKILESNE